MSDIEKSHKRAFELRAPYNQDRKEYLNAMDIHFKNNAWQFSYSDKSSIFILYRAIQKIENFKVPNQEIQKLLKSSNRSFIHTGLDYSQPYLMLKSHEPKKLYQYLDPINNHNLLSCNQEFGIVKISKSYPISNLNNISNSLRPTLNWFLNQNEVELSTEGNKLSVDFWHDPKIVNILSKHSIKLSRIGRRSYSFFHVQIAYTACNWQVIYDLLEYLLKSNKIEAGQLSHVKETLNRLYFHVPDRSILRFNPSIL